MADFIRNGEMEHPISFNFDNTYARLPERFFARLEPTPVRLPELIKLNEELAQYLGIDPEELRTVDGVRILSGSKNAKGAEPLAMAYAGHQFGSWVPQLGDGRAILLGELVASDGARFDLQLKGSGRTPFSRMGDGRAVLGPVLREYIVSEAMHCLGIPTTRALAAVSTGEGVVRENLLPGAILTRVAKSHVRVGTFQFFSARKDGDAIRALADYVIQRNFPDLKTGASPYHDLLREVVARQAKLVAKWQLVGFIHGVMNTDNTSVVGETIDYGPCAFMDFYHPDTVYSSIDQSGRYSFGNQPGIAYWNLGCFAQTLLPLLDEDSANALSQAEEILGTYPDLFQQSYLLALSKKMGLLKELDGDQKLGQDLLRLMEQNEADYTLTFRGLSPLGSGNGNANGSVRHLFKKPDQFDEWELRWRKRLSEESFSPAQREQFMKTVNPAFIPRNHLIEEAIKLAVDDNDFSEFHRLVEVLSNPYENQADTEKYAVPPRPEQIVRATFCGT